MPICRPSDNSGQGRIRWYRHANKAVPAVARPAPPQINGDPPFVGPAPTASGIKGSPAVSGVVDGIVVRTNDDDDDATVDATSGAVVGTGSAWVVVNSRFVVSIELVVVETEAVELVGGDDVVVAGVGGVPPRVAVTSAMRLPAT